MEIKSYADLLKIHTFFEELLTRQLAMQEGKQPPSSATLTVVQRADVDTARNCAAAAERRHAVLMRRAVAERAAHNDALARLKGNPAHDGVPAAKGKKAARAAKPK